ncbi:hypothetical protein OIU84_008082 [Salix udensis]|uniref:Helicase ATP-binding domain-containing protein n=1 Tax=Salix udensis TaxID=889485 RepID=A0AAD6JUG9_9ROSI|nr:hypothetical protein OIU84_008082 [Salix udensis]
MKATAYHEYTWPTSIQAQGSVLEISSPSELPSLWAEQIIADQRSELRAGVDVIVAAPRRFTDHLQQGNTSLSRISFIVLDEAGRMLDMGFELLIREVHDSAIC